MKTIDISKRTKGEYFWSENYLMQNNDDGSFSSSHILELGRIKPEENVKAFILSACNNHDKLVEALKAITQRFELEQMGYNEPLMAKSAILTAKELLKSIEDIKDC